MEHFDRDPAYLGLAAELQLLIGDGRLGQGVKLPSERALTAALGVSRTTVSAAYEHLCAAGFALACHGSGTYTARPAHIDRALDRALMPGGRVTAGPVGADTIDLNCAANVAAAGLAGAYARAASEIPGYFGGHGYFPAGLPELQSAVAASFADRGLATTPDQIIITPGALSALAVAAHGLCGRGDRVLVESPVYPNAADVLRLRGVRFVEAQISARDDSGWHTESMVDVIGTARPTAAYLVPEFQNPTGHLMSDIQRAALADAFERAGTVAIVDETHHALLLDGDAMPAPFAAHSPAAVTVGSASKSVWGGLRVGWIRAPLQLVPKLIQARLTLDLGVPVFEQLVATHVLADFAAIVGDQRTRLRAQREALAAAVTEQLPDWSFRLPSGGLCLWCELPRPVATDVVAAAEQLGVIVAPGPIFSVSGGLNRFVRIPWTRPAAELTTAVDRLAEAWRSVLRAPDRTGQLATGTSGTGDARVMVA